MKERIIERTVNGIRVTSHICVRNSAGEQRNSGGEMNRCESGKETGAAAVTVGDEFSEYIRTKEITKRKEHFAYERKNNRAYR